MTSTTKTSFLAKGAALILAGTVILAGCNNETGTTSGPTTTPPPVTTATTAAPTTSPTTQPEITTTAPPNPTTTPSTRPPRPDGKLCGKGVNGCYSKPEMEEYYRKIIPLIQNWAKDTYGDSVPDVAEYQYIPTGKQGSSKCRGAVTSKTFAYCPADDKILVGQDALWTLYGMGDAAPMLGVAHEWGHHLQRVKKVPIPRNNAESIQHENQADCIAGGWTQYATLKNNLAFPGDYGDIVKVLAFISSAEGPDRDHGTLEERFGSVGKGAVGGLNACNAFYPQTPVK